MTKLKVEGMTCEHCQAAVKRALESVDGTTSVEVDLVRGEASVEGSTDVSTLVAAVESEGYQASPLGS